MARPRGAEFLLDEPAETAEVVNGSVITEDDEEAAAGTKDFEAVTGDIKERRVAFRKSFVAPLVFF